MLLNSELALEQVLGIHPSTISLGYDPTENHEMSTGPTGQTFSCLAKFIEDLVNDLKHKTKKTSSNTHAPAANVFLLDFVELLKKRPKRKDKKLAEKHADEKAAFDKACSNYHAVGLGQTFNLSTSKLYIRRCSEGELDIKTLSDGTRILLRNQQPVFDIHQLHCACYNIWKADETSGEFAWKTGTIDSKTTVSDFVKDNMGCAYTVVIAALFQTANTPKVPWFRKGSIINNNFNINVDGTTTVKIDQDGKITTITPTEPGSPSKVKVLGYTRGGRSVSTNSNENEIGANDSTEPTSLTPDQFREFHDVMANCEYNRGALVYTGTDMSNIFDFVWKSLEPETAAEGLDGRVIVVRSKPTANPDCFIFLDPEDQNVGDGNQGPLQMMGDAFVDGGYEASQTLYVISHDGREAKVALFTRRYRDSEEPLRSFVRGLAAGGKDKFDSLELSAMMQETFQLEEEEDLRLLATSVKSLHLTNFVITIKQQRTLSKLEADIRFDGCFFSEKGEGFFYTDEVELARLRAHLAAPASP